MDAVQEYWNEKGAETQRKKDIEVFSQSLVKEFGLSKKEADNFLKEVFEEELAE